jgi:transposase
MKKIIISSHFSDKSLKNIMNSQTDVRAFKGWQIIYSAQSNPGQSRDDIAKMLCVSPSTVYRAVKDYSRHGKNWYICRQRGGRRQQRCHLSLEDEKLLMKSLESDALSGKILIFKHIKKRVEDRVGKEVSDDYIWDLFSRHGWSKKVPRQHHPRADRAAQEEYKKNLRKIWMPGH